MNENHLELIMQLIMQGGDAKGNAINSIQEAKKGNFDKSKELLNNAEESINKAHNAQTRLLTLEAQGNNSEMTLLMVHAQDHLMTGITFIDLAKELIDVYKVIQKYESTNK